jgi:hypothetical protein
MINFITESGLILSELSNELHIFINDIPKYMILIFLFFCIILFTIIIGSLLKVSFIKIR